MHSIFNGSRGYSDSGQEKEMPIKDLLSTLTNQDKLWDNKVISKAIMKYLETDSSKVKFTVDERDSTFINIFRDCFVTE